MRRYPALFLKFFLYGKEPVWTPRHSICQNDPNTYRHGRFPSSPADLLLYDTFPLPHIYIPLKELPHRLCFPHRMHRDCGDCLHPQEPLPPSFLPDVWEFRSPLLYGNPIQALKSHILLWWVLKPCPQLSRFPLLQWLRHLPQILNAYPKSNGHKDLIQDKSVPPW